MARRLTTLNPQLFFVFPKIVLAGSSAIAFFVKCCFDIVRRSSKSTLGGTEKAFSCDFVVLNNVHPESIFVHEKMNSVWLRKVYINFI